MGIAKVKVAATLGFTAAAIGGAVYQYRNSSGPPGGLESSSASASELQLLVQKQQRVLDLLEGLQRLQTSEQTALRRAAAAENSNRQLAQEAQELRDSRDAAVALHQQPVQALRQARHLAEMRPPLFLIQLRTPLSAFNTSLMSRKARLPGNTASPLNYRILLFRGGHGGQNGSGERVTHHVAELRKSFQQAQLSHTTVVQRLRQQLQDALESHTASQGQLEGQLAAEKQARSAVSRDLVAAQREMEALVQHNLELASAAMGGQAYQAQVEQEELRASLEAQLAELTSVTDVRGAEEASLERMRRDAKQHTAGMAAVEAQMERMGRDASDAAHLQEQVQQLQARERLQGEVTGANKQVQAELAAQAAGRQQAISDLQEQVSRLQQQLARAQNAPSPAQVHTKLHTRMTTVSSSSRYLF
ncbi:TPA: hypothetical protein ACH3X1_002010 [Trebouxia sp. C0004]